MPGQGKPEAIRLVQSVGRGPFYQLRVLLRCLVLKVGLLLSYLECDGGKGGTRPTLSRSEVGSSDCAVKSTIGVVGVFCISAIVNVLSSLVVASATTNSV